MPTWTIAGVQMDCRLADPDHNLFTIRAKLREAARRGAKLVIFPECAIPGYCFTSKAEAWEIAEPLPGPSTKALEAECRELGVWAVVGLLERDEASGELFNAAALVGPDGLAGAYRKAHLPCLGVDRFTDRGDRPFAVHDLGGLRLAVSGTADETILYAEIDPARARQKRIVNIPGEYEVDRVKDRRPELYGPLVGK